jgi:hypothetical protein
MSKKVNGVGAKRNVLASIEAATKKVEGDRWLTQTEEGREFVRNENAKKEQALLKSQFSLGQLVWKRDFEGGDEKLVDRCSKIVEIGDYELTTEMLYVNIDGKKCDEYIPSEGMVYMKGDKVVHPFYQLEKHVAKSGNIWWKVK